MGMSYDDQVPIQGELPSSTFGMHQPQVALVKHDAGGDDGGGDDGGGDDDGGDDGGGEGMTGRT